MRRARIPKKDIWWKTKAFLWSLHLADDVLGPLKSFSFIRTHSTRKSFNMCLWFSKHSHFHSAQPNNWAWMKKYSLMMRNNQKTNWFYLFYGWDGGGADVNTCLMGCLDQDEGSRMSTKELRIWEWYVQTRWTNEISILPFSAIICCCVYPVFVY